MSTNIIRRTAGLVVSATAIGAAALGLAGTVAAAAVVPTPEPGIVAVPSTVAHPAVDATPGYWWHRHHPSLLDPTTAAGFGTPGA